MWRLPHSVANRRNAATSMAHHSDIGDWPGPTLGKSHPYCAVDPYPI